MPITTTLNRIHAHAPCGDGWRKLLAGLGKTTADDEPLSYARIVEINGLDDALWACRAEPQHDKEWRLFAVDCARLALAYTSDWRAVAAVNVAERYAHGMATQEQLTAAREDACDTRAITWEATWTARAASSARQDAWAAAWAATWAATWAAQTKKFLEIVGE